MKYQFSPLIYQIISSSEYLKSRGGPTASRWATTQESSIWGRNSAGRPARRRRRGRRGPRLVRGRGGADCRQRKEQGHGQGKGKEEEGRQKEEEEEEEGREGTAAATQGDSRGNREGRGRRGSRGRGSIREPLVD